MSLVVSATDARFDALERQLESFEVRVNKKFDLLYEIIQIQSANMEQVLNNHERIISIVETNSKTLESHSEMLKHLVNALPKQNIKSIQRSTILNNNKELQCPTRPIGPKRRA